jgi:hypothetical protein
MQIQYGIKNGVKNALLSLKHLDLFYWLVLTTIKLYEYISHLKFFDYDILGAPGIGKSRFTKTSRKTWEGRNILVKIHDGSSHEFKNLALADILDKDLREIGNCEIWYLIMDEYHMMPTDLKEQLLNWVYVHANVHLLMIGNRYDSVDLELFTNCTHQDVSSIIVRARSSPDFFLGNLLLYIYLRSIFSTYINK